MANFTSEEVLEYAEIEAEQYIECLEHTFVGESFSLHRRETIQDHIRINAMENIILQTMLDLDKPTQH